MRIIICLLLFTTTFSYGCLIELPEEIIKIYSKSFSINQNFIKSNCPESVTNYLSSLLADIGSEVSSEYLQNIIFEETNILPSITPKSIKLSNLEDYINQSLDNNFRAENIKLVSKNETLKRKSSDHISISCDNCDHTGHKNIKLTITEAATKKQNTYWLSATITQKSKHIVAKRKIAAAETLNPSDFEIIERFSADQQILNIDLESLKYFKSTRIIDANRSLANNFVTAQNIVTRGMPTSVVYSSSGIKLMTTALPMQNGKINDTIQLETQNGKKKISATVIDYNKVQINL
jgi:flagella basal body P-ring formation protein FlgA